MINRDMLFITSCIFNVVGAFRDDVALVLIGMGLLCIALAAKPKPTRNDDLYS